MSVLWTTLLIPHTNRQSDVKQLADLMLRLSTVQCLCLWGQQWQTSAQSVRQEKQLDWIMSSWDSFKQSTNLAVTLWPKIYFPGASPMRAKQHDSNKSPPPDMTIIEPLVVNVCPCVHAKSLLHSSSTKTLELVKPCKKKLKTKRSPLLLLSVSLPVKSFYKHGGMRLDNRQEGTEMFPRRKDTR